MSAPEKTVADPIAGSAVYPIGSRVNERGHLEVGGCDVVEVAHEHGTPAYIYAEDDIRDRALEFLRAFGERTDNFEVVFASKALPLTAAYRLLAEEDLSVDVASGGELRLALAGGFAPERIHMHGNNKTEAELEYAIASNVGHIIVDSFDEIARLDGMLDRAQRVLVRVTPGIKPTTHSYIQTGQLDSKFGFGLEEGLAERALNEVRAAKNLELVGLHAHIGSQIFELEPFTKEIEAIAAFCNDLGYEPELLNVGGGLGIAYTAEDDPASIDDYAEVKVRGVREAFGDGPRILVEPGRSLVGNAGITAYEIGTFKEIPGVRTYVAVDGGMSDNPRPALYGARYTALLANRADEQSTAPYTVVGKHCESGDMLIERVDLPKPRRGDILAVPTTGAYTLAMSSTYNAVPRPAVVLVRDGGARLIRRRETIDDLLALES
jgi:diaminopimelate decarboxylase